MKNWRGIIAVAIVCLISLGIIMVASSPPRGIPVELLPPPTIAPLTVHVTGEVNIPGVYSLPNGSRVENAVRAAGGFTDDADENAINLAFHLEDGIQIRIPSLTDPNKAEPPFMDNSEQTNQRFTPILGELIDINTATQKELESLPGIGPVIAEAIIAYREVEGTFISIEEIQKVDGIGPTKFESIRHLISVVIQ